MIKFHSLKFSFIEDMITWRIFSIILIIDKRYEYQIVKYKSIILKTVKLKEIYINKKINASII